MKLYKKVGANILLLIVSFAIFTGCGKSSSITNTKSVEVSNTTPPDDNNELSTEDIENIMRETDSRVEEIKNKINFEYRVDCYDNDILMYRYFDCGIEYEDHAGYDLYYNEQGKIIYAEIVHHRGALYTIYFHNDELLHVEVGPFHTDDDVFIKGGMKEVEEAIKKDPSYYAFVLEDISLCLEHAYEEQ